MVHRIKYQLLSRNTAKSNIKFQQKSDSARQRKNVTQELDVDLSI